MKRSDNISSSRRYEAREIEGSCEDLNEVDLDAIKEVKEEETICPIETLTVQPVRVKDRSWRLRRSRKVSYEDDTPRIRRRAIARSNFRNKSKKMVRFESALEEDHIHPKIFPLGAYYQKMKSKPNSGVSKYKEKQSKEQKHLKVHVELNPRALEHLLEGDFDQAAGSRITIQNPDSTRYRSTRDCSPASKDNFGIDQEPSYFAESNMARNIDSCARTAVPSGLTEERASLRRRRVALKDPSADIDECARDTRTPICTEERTRLQRSRVALKDPAAEENSSDEEITLDSVLASWGAV